MLHSTLHYIRLRPLGNRIIRLNMYPNTGILGYQDSRTVFTVIDVLVYEIEPEYRDRCSDLHPSAANLA